MGVQVRYTHKAKYVAAGALLGALSVPGTAIAQVQTDAPASLFERDRNISVRERPRPDYISNGYNIGTFQVQPEIGLAVEYYDNVFGDAVDEESDVVYVAQPAVIAESTWSRHSLVGDAAVSSRNYQEFTDENTVDYTVGVGGRLDILRSAFVEAGARYSDLHEQRTAPGLANRAAEPIEYDQADVFVGTQVERGRVRLGAEVDTAFFDFDDVALENGGVGDLDFRDRTEYGATARADVAISPDTAIFLRGSVRDYQYYQRPAPGELERDSTGYTVDTGADFDIRGVARGVVGAGYTEREFEDPTLDNISGVTLNGSLEWFATDLTTVTFNSSRGVSEAAIGSAAAFLSTSVSATIDHELRRNIIVSGTVSWEEDDYQNIDRNDNRIQVAAGVSYFVNRHLGLRASYAYVDQTADGSAGFQEYDRNILAVSLVARP